MIAKKIMKVPCIVTSELYHSGNMMPLGAIVSGRMPPPGIGWLGNPSCQRINMASVPPTSRKNRHENRNWIPMIL